MAKFRIRLREDEILNIVKNDIINAENYFNSEILPKLKEWQDLYFANEEYYKGIMPILSQQSKFVSKDVASAVEWILPQLVKIFLGADDIIVVRGRTADDVKKAKIMQKLINFQLNIENNAFVVMYRWMKDALINGCGILKAVWHREYEHEIIEDYIGEEQFQMLTNDPNIKILDFDVDETQSEEFQKTYKVKYQLKKIKQNYPKLYNVRPEHFGFDPLATSIDDANFCFHKKIVDADYLRRKKDVYKNVEKAIESGSGELGLQNMYATYSQNLNLAQLNVPDQEARKKFWLYEYYGKIDVNNDGLLENVIVVVCNDVILSIQENTYEMFPFFILSPIIEPYKFWGRGYGDIIGQLQNLKTMLIREIIINVSQSNNGRLIINQDFVNIDDLLSNSKYIRTRGNMPIQNIATPYPFQPIHQATFPLLEFIEVTKENEQGITRYSQGLDARSLNKRLDINLPVPMADGSWKLLKDIKDGDMILSGDGKPTKVLKAHEIKWCDDAYELEFSNGDIIKADAEHLWGVYVDKKHYKVLFTKDLFELKQKGIDVYLPEFGNTEIAGVKLIDIKPTKGCYMRCLTVDNEKGLWIIGKNYTVTHNTATGISLIMNASQQRIELVARIFAETGFKRLFRFLVEANLKFIDKQQVIRLTDEELEIAPDDLTGKYDLIVNAGMGLSTKQQQIQQYELILSIATQTLLPLGLATPRNIRNIVKRLLEEMGYKNINDFLATDEELAQQQQQNMMQQLLASQKEYQTAKSEETENKKETLIDLLRGEGNA